MDENELTTALEDRVADLDAGPPPLEAMTGRARGARRRRRAAAVVAAVAAIVVAGVGVAVTTGDGPDGAPLASDPAPDVPAGDAEPPAGQRFVGVGSLAVAVPEEWPTNALSCGTPSRDTAIVDVGAICLALVPFPDGVSSVEVRAPLGDETFNDWRPVEVRGGEVLRSPTATSEEAVGTDPVVVHSARVALPGGRAVVEVQSSVSAERVDELLAGVVVLDDDRVAVPGFSDLAFGGGDQAATYGTRLERLGLTIETSEGPRRRGYPRGTVLSVAPSAGSVVDVGSTVRVTVAS